MDFPPEVEKSYYEDNKRFGEELPERIKNRPNLFPGLALFFNAWFELDGERERSSLQRIKRSDVFTYAFDYDFTLWQTLDLWFYIRRMDAEFLEWWKKKHPPKNPKGKRNG